LINISRYRIIAVGKIKKAWIQQGVNAYLKRLPGLTVTEIRDSNPEKEALNVISSLKKGEILVVLSEEFPTLCSVQFSNKLNEFSNQRLAFVIGGSSGISAKLKSIADWSLGLSSLTFPHEIARLLLIEQLYRAQSIHTNSPYHRA
tara:strand:- start:152 stop:589 length:438 start_codon:yes stop_codon:yes gene_type:complete